MATERRKGSSPGGKGETARHRIRDTAIIAAAVLTPVSQTVDIGSKILDRLDLGNAQQAGQLDPAADVQWEMQQSMATTSEPARKLKAYLATRDMIRSKLAEASSFGLSGHIDRANELFAESVDKSNVSAEMGPEFRGYLSLSCIGAALLAIRESSENAEKEDELLAEASDLLRRAITINDSLSFSSMYAKLRQGVIRTPPANRAEKSKIPIDEERTQSESRQRGDRQSRRESRQRREGAADLAKLSESFPWLDPNTLRTASFLPSYEAWQAVQAIILADQVNGLAAEVEQVLGLRRYSGFRREALSLRGNTQLRNLHLIVGAP